MQLLEDGVGHVVEIGLVLARDHDVGQPGPVGGEQLLLQPTDRQHLALQGDLTGHPDERVHGAIGEQAHQRGRHRDAGRGPVLRHGPGGEVHVEAPPEGVGGNVQLVATTTDVAECDLTRLGHHVAQLAGEGQALVAVHRRGLDDQDVTTRTGHGQAVHDTGSRLTIAFVVLEAGATQRVLEVVDIDGDRCRLTTGNTSRRLAQHLAELTLQVAHAGLAGVLLDDLRQGLVGHDDLVVA